MNTYDYYTQASEAEFSCGSLSFLVVDCRDSDFEFAQSLTNEADFIGGRLCNEKGSLRNLALGPFGVSSSSVSKNVNAKSDEYLLSSVPPSLRNSFQGLWKYFNKSCAKENLPVEMHGSMVSQ